MKAAARRPDKLLSDHDGLCGAGLCGAGKHSVPGPTRVFGTRVRKTWTKVCETGIAAHYVRNLVLDNRSRRYEVVVLPLASDGQEIDMLISVQRETRSDPRQAQR